MMEIEMDEVIRVLKVEENNNVDETYSECLVLDLSAKPAKTTDAESEMKAQESKSDHTVGQPENKDGQISGSSKRKCRFKMRFAPKKIASDINMNSVVMLEDPRARTTSSDISMRLDISTESQKVKTEISKEPPHTPPTLPMLPVLEPSPFLASRSSVDDHQSEPLSPSESLASDQVPLEGRYPCKSCLMRFRSNIGLQRHEVEIHGKVVISCDECSKTFGSQSALNDHKKRVHGPRQYACGLCNADFTSEAYLRAHTKVHAEKKYTCTVCAHSFVNKTDLNNHMRVHNGEKPYPCEVCGKRFRHVSGFYTHVRIHTGETPYKCEFCEKLFTNASNYQTHRKIHTREKRFKCDSCGKEFIQQSNFSRHLRIHTKERPYVCRQCPSSFTYSTALKKHEDREHGIRPFPCGTCGRTFLNETSLVRHRTGCELKDCVKQQAQENSAQFL